MIKRFFHFIQKKTKNKKTEKKEREKERKKTEENGPCCFRCSEPTFIDGHFRKGSWASSIDKNMPVR